MDDILAQARKIAEEAEVFSISADETQVQFEANRLKHIQSKQATSRALRIIRQGKTGYASTTKAGDSRELVNMAVETARFGMPAGFEFPPLSTYPKVEVFDSAVETVPIEKMVELGEEMIDAIISRTPDIVCEAAVARGTVSVRIVNSRGGEVEYQKSIFSLGIEGSLIRGTDMLFVSDSESSCQPILLTGAVAQSVLEQLDLAENQASVRTGTLPVIFTPKGVASALVLPLMAAFNGKMVLQGASPVGNRLGEQVFDRQLSLWDDPLVSYRPASRPADDEGVLSQRTALIEQGNVAHFLYDLQTAALAHTTSTGSGGRNRGLPTPTSSAFVIAPGSTTLEEMVSDIKEGLIIEQLMGAEQGNILGGDFSGNVLLGYKIENGKITGRVKDTMVSGNVYRLLKEIVAIGREAKWVGGSLQAPHIYCLSLSVASK
jgi:PmbA protein